MTKTNSLMYKTVKTVGKETIHVKIELSDDCKNGHQDFSITGDIYEAGKPKTDRYFISGGCIHEDIAKHFPEFKIFIALHLCDWEGIPMHAVANGFYHLREGFSKTPTEDPLFKNEYCEYYRVTPEQFEGLNKCKNQLQFAIALKDLGILAQWQKQAQEAIKQLEALTGNDFLPDSEKSQYQEPTPAEIAEELEKQKSGYYTPEAEKQRELNKQAAIIEKLQADRDKSLFTINSEFDVKVQVLKIGGKKALDNCIFYYHSLTLAFNWRGTDKISSELIQQISEQIKLPEGVTIKNEVA